DGHICILLVGRVPPFDAAQRTALPQFRLPEHLASLIRIETPYDTRLLAANQNALATGKGAQNRRCAEVEIRPDRLGAIRAAAAARHREIILRLYLARPEQTAAFQIESQDGVG